MTSKAACTETLVYRMRGWAVEKLKIVNAKLVRRLVNAKYFENDRFRGLYFVAVDAVHRDGCRGRPRFLEYLAMYECLYRAKMNFAIIKALKRVWT